MKDILEELFYHRYQAHPDGPEPPDHETRSKQLDSYYEQICDMLGKPFFDALYDAFMELCETENLYYFRKGVQLGGQIMIAILDLNPGP